MKKRERRKPHTHKMYDDVRDEYKRLSEIKEFGVQKHSFDWIIAKVAEKFYRSPKTIENIIFNRV